MSPDHHPPQEDTNFKAVWVGFSIPIDIILVTIPLQILKRAKLRVHERKLLKWIFSSTLMGTLIL